MEGFGDLVRTFDNGVEKSGCRWIFVQGAVAPLSSWLSTRSATMPSWVSMVVSSSLELTVMFGDSFGPSYGRGYLILELAGVVLETGIVVVLHRD